MYNLADWSAAGVLLGHSWEGRQCYPDVFPRIYRLLVWQLALFGNYLLSGSFDHSIRIWDLETKETVKVLEGHKGYIHAVLSYVQEKLILTAGGDKVIKIWR